MEKKKSVIAIVGGGRWGRVLLSVLAAEKHVPFEAIIIISKNNTQIIDNFIKNNIKTHCASMLPIHVINSIEQALENYEIHAAIVVNSAKDHFDTGMFLLEQGVHLLIEKPFCLTSEHARILIEKANKNNLCLLPGLNYRFCSYLSFFSDKLKKYERRPLSFLIKWSDSINEIRYGENKIYDSSVNVVQDVMPHIWTLINTIFNKNSIDIQECKLSNQNHSVTFSVSLEDLPGKIILERNALSRKRIISIEFEENSPLTNMLLDFTVEPGEIFFNGEVTSADITWEINPKPLSKQLRYFFCCIDKKNPLISDMQACIDSVFASEKAATLYKEQLNLNVMVLDE